MERAAVDRRPATIAKVFKKSTARPSRAGRTPSNAKGYNIVSLTATQPTTCDHERPDQTRPCGDCMFGTGLVEPAPITSDGLALAQAAANRILKRQDHWDSERLAHLYETLVEAFDRRQRMQDAAEVEPVPDLAKLQQRIVEHVQAGGSLVDFRDVQPWNILVSLLLTAAGWRENEQASETSLLGYTPAEWAEMEQEIRKPVTISGLRRWTESSGYGAIRQTMAARMFSIYGVTPKPPRRGRPNVSVEARDAIRKMADDPHMTNREIAVAAVERWGLNRNTAESIARRHRVKKGMHSTRR